jgi:hypothetical protein
MKWLRKSDTHTMVCLISFIIDSLFATHGGAFYQTHTYRMAESTFRYEFLKIERKCCCCCCVHRFKFNEMKMNNERAIDEAKCSASTVKKLFGKYANERGGRRRGGEENRVVNATCYKVGTHYALRCDRTIKIAMN